MELWFSESHTPNAKFSIRVDKQIYSGHSEFQRIDVFESQEFGRFLALDGYLMCTEKDEFIYHEMITHVPMAVHKNARKILVIGGGDGGAVRELVRYDRVETIHMVEIDPEVVQVCKNYMPFTAGWLDDPRVTLFYEDGLKYIRRQVDEYDLIIVDSTDPLVRGGSVYQGVLRQLFQGPQRGRHHGQPARKSLLRKRCGGHAEGSQADCPELPHQPGVSGAHSHLPFGALAVRLCLQAASPPAGF